MAIEQVWETPLYPAVTGETGEGRALSTRPPAPASNLAQLLDSFTQAMTRPEQETIGGFAATVEALHGELAMLAHMFGAQAHLDGASEQAQFDDIFPGSPATGHEELEPGIAEAEELEHLCRELSRE